jgi:N-acetyl sugar amidotransferase
MDTTDPAIAFDAAGVCNHCRRVEALKASAHWMPDERGAEHIRHWVARIKREQRRARYDCIIGLSGGCDSSYLALVAHRLGLRCLALHVDGGWNSELAVKNIERIVKRLGLDLVTHVVRWDEMRDLQVAFLRSGVPNQDIPQDHVFFSVLYAEAKRHRIRFSLQGRNYASESVLPTGWGYGAMDGHHLRAIHRRFGSGRLRRFRVLSLLEHVDLFVGLPWSRSIEVVDFLNFMPYDPRVARRELAAALGWEDYGDKHCESRWTKFFQQYYLPKRFDFDKRKAHLSSLILSGQLARQQALNELQRPPYDEDSIADDANFIRKKLRLGEPEWRAILDLPPRRHFDYPNRAKAIARATQAALVLRALARPRRAAAILKGRVVRMLAPAGP